MAAVQVRPKSAEPTEPSVRQVPLTEEKILQVLRQRDDEAKKAYSLRVANLLGAQRLRLSAMQKQLLASAPKLLKRWAPTDHYRGDPTPPKKDFEKLLVEAQQLLSDLKANAFVKVIAAPNRGKTIEQRLQTAIKQMKTAWSVQPPAADSTRGSAVQAARTAEFWNTFFTPLYETAEHFSQVKLADPADSRPLSGLGGLFESADREVWATISSLASNASQAHPTVINAFDGAVVPLGATFNVPGQGIRQLYSTCRVGNAFMATITRPGETQGTCVRLPLRRLPGYAGPVALIPT